MDTRYAVGPLGSGKTTWMRKQVEQWPVSHRLVLASNSQRKQAMAECLRGAATGDLGIYTYTGWVRTCLYDHWPYVEAQLATAQLPGDAVIIPELSGYRDSETLLHQLITHMRQQNPQAFAGFPGTDGALVRQMLRRLRQRSENRLTRDDMRTRSELLDHPCLAAVCALERLFDHWSYRLRMLDPAKQLDIFHQLLTHDVGFQAWLGQRVRYLAVDDWDETTPAQQQFVAHLLNSGLTAFVATCDPDGGSRRGYLNAFPYDWPRLLAQYPGSVEICSRTDAWSHEADRLLQRWKTNGPSVSQASDDLPYQRHHLPTQEAQFSQLKTQITQWQEAGISLGDIAVSTPMLTLLQRHCLQQALTGLPVQWLSGTETPWQNPTLRIFVILLQWLNQHAWQTHPLWEKAPLTHQDLRDALRFWQHPLWHQAFDTAQLAADDGLAFWHQFKETHADLDTAQQLLPLFKTCLAPYLDAVTDLSALTAIIQRYATRFVPIQQAFDATAPIGLQWVIAAKQGLIAETPRDPLRIEPDCLIIGTPQKLIDAEVRRPCYIWLDCAHPDWHRTDNAPLYDAWVHSAAWQDGLLPELAPESLPQDEWLVRVRAAHICRTLMLLANDRLVCLYAEVDILNRPLAGLLPEMLPCERLPSVDIPVLRPDQAPVLNYQQGTMAISAVPGAGKTFVTVALLLHLVERQGIAPERVLVLTFMDSAAKTLLSRLRPHLGSRLPQVSTIHSLAYRIVRHGNHAQRLGLDMETVTILDDVTQQQLVQQVAAQTLPANVSLDAWTGTVQTGLNRLKAHGLTGQHLADWLDKHPEDERIQEFYAAVQCYDAHCREHNSLDFNDLIQLSIRLLTEHEDIRRHYQQQIHLIIEDEAQDSSAALQTLLGLLGGQQPNLIRTGDSNQSISATFSAADAKVFRAFVQSAETAITMDGSGRCAPEVMTLANQWMHWCARQPDLENAFIPVAMTPVPGANPTLIRPLQSRVFDTTQEEKAAIIADINDVLQLDEIGRKAVLVRTNYQAGDWIQALTSAGIPCVSAGSPPLLTETLDCLFAWLAVLRQPESSKLLVDFINTYQPLCPAASQLKPLLQGQSIVQLPHVRHPLAQRLYYDWLDVSRQLTGQASWLVRLATLLTDEPRAQQILLTLADKIQPLINAMPDPLTWLCENQATVTSMMRNLLKRQQDTVIPDGHVLVTTMHTAKGQEYDWVWMPELTGYSYPFTMDQVKSRERRDSFHLEVSLARLSTHRSQPRDAVIGALRRDKMAEEARLLYVGITRARRSLWLSAAETGQTFKGKPQPLTPHPLVTGLN